MHAKSVHIIFSVGTEDRDRTYEEFLEWIRKKIGPVKPGAFDEEGNVVRNPGVHMTVTGGYYILDGKVCLPDDYDTEKGNFKPGAVPPTWAGGPSKKTFTIAQQIEHDMKTLSEDAFDQKYSLGKYAPKPVAPSVTPEAKRKVVSIRNRAKERLEDEELEEFEWDEDDVTDDAKMGAIADESASRAVKRLTGKKRVVKKPAAKPVRKVVRKK
jgi:hypothetical protein